MEESDSCINIVEAELISNFDDFPFSEYYLNKYGSSGIAFLKAMKCNCANDCICKNCMIVSTVDIQTDNIIFDILHNNVIGLGRILSSIKNII